MADLKRTVLYDEHVKLGGKMIDFGGWEMPVNYPTGIVKEHSATRESAGLFDVSHMGRFKISGKDSLAFLQYALTNNAEALEPRKAQYTIIQNETGGAVDDTYLYRFNSNDYILVVNASNRDKDMAHLKRLIGKYDVEVTDVSDEDGMIALQGPDSIDILAKASDGSDSIELLSNMKRNEIARIVIDSILIEISKTGYTGEKVGFELFVPAGSTPTIWNKLIELGATPVGLGARDTLRLEAGMPLYGHELGVIEGMGSDGNATTFDIPIFTGGLAKFAVSFDEAKGDFYGKDSLLKSSEDPTEKIMKFELKGKGIPRAGYEITKDGKRIGVVTSGTILPDKRAIGQGLIHIHNENSGVDSDVDGGIIQVGDEVEIVIRNKPVTAVIVKSNLK